LDDLGLLLWILHSEEDREAAKPPEESSLGLFVPQGHSSVTACLVLLVPVRRPCRLLPVLAFFGVPGVLAWPIAFASGVTHLSLPVADFSAARLLVSLVQSLISVDA